MKHLVSLGAALFVLIFLFSQLNANFLTQANGLNVLEQITINSLLAFGMTFVILLGGIDLSVGSVVALSGVTSVFVTTFTGSSALGLASGVAAGACVGLCNGLFIGVAGLPPFIVTLGTMSIARGLAFVFTWENWGAPLDIDESHTALRALADYQIVFLLTVFIFSLVLLYQTRFGHYVFAIGGNREAARFTGLRITQTETLVYVLSGSFAGVAGVINASLLWSADPSSGQMYELNAIAAVVVGGTSFTGGIGNLFGTLLGAMLIGVLGNGLNLLGVHFSMQHMVKGAVIIFAVLVDVLRRRGRRT